jgi:hypothetical protein
MNALMAPVTSMSRHLREVSLCWLPSWSGGLSEEPVLGCELAALESARCPVPFQAGPGRVVEHDLVDEVGQSGLRQRIDSMDVDPAAPWTPSAGVRRGRR